MIVATSNFNSIILASARKLKDERTYPTSAGDTGKVFTAAVLAEYTNRAVRDFLTAQFIKLTEALGQAAAKEEFARRFPEYIATSGSLTLSSGSVAKPTDCWFVLDLSKSDLSLKFEPLEPDEIGSVLVSDAGLDNASATHPKFYEQGTTIKTLGVTSGDVIARYIRFQTDITSVTGTAGNGHIFTDAAYVTWTAATRLLSFNIAGSPSGYTASDIGKVVSFRTATVAYVGIIEAVNSSADPITVTLRGDGIPSGNIAAPDIIDIICADVGPVDSDLKLNANWYGEIIERVVAMGEADQARLIQQ